MDAIQCYALQDAQGHPLITAGMTLRDAQLFSPTSSTRALTQENMQDVFPTRPCGVVLAFGRLVSHTSDLIPVLEGLLGDYLPIELQVIAFEGVFNSLLRDFLLLCLSRKTPRDLKVHIVQTTGDTWTLSNQPDITYSFGFGVCPSYSPNSISSVTVSSRGFDGPVIRSLGFLPNLTVLRIISESAVAAKLPPPSTCLFPSLLKLEFYGSIPDACTALMACVSASNSVQEFQIQAASLSGPQDMRFLRETVHASCPVLRTLKVTIRDCHSAEENWMNMADFVPCPFSLTSLTVLHPTVSFSLANGFLVED
ncbi:uncharacterized protein BT62DRAFT_213147 [Guyanagaster necrorhizus]|uniref:Uncharacterized protein n=1 Tax=Guyanagaster necrorhizus TaxID=856835 RepID=A0A9P8ARG1_9AGAR|nr:uncharacterized protein BT62DRAFT_213147 [Guyanagaster necrorhizus MCA 3950]KAG7445159.1 hypothetical protein BT62DRAFT_213147 [Guyanagaster necrorhizus MCA 3950]